MKVRWNVSNPTTLTSTMRGPSAHLKQGINEIDDDVFEALMECESNREHVSSGRLTNPEEDGLDDEPEALEVEAGEDEEPEVDAPTLTAEPGPHDALESLDEFTVDGASDVIGDTFDPEVLRRWAAADERKGVASAIADQLELIEGAGG